MPISLKNMRGCASPASTAICSSTSDHRAMIRHSTSGTPRHHRLNSYLQDQYNHLIPSRSPGAPCISELPITPRPALSSLYRKGGSGSGSGSPAAGDSASRRSSAEIRDFLSRRRRSADVRRSPPASSSSTYLLMTETASLRRQDLALVPSDEEEVRDVGPTAHASHGAVAVGKLGGDLVRSVPGYRRHPQRSRALVMQPPLSKEAAASTTLASAADQQEGNQRLRLTKPSSAPSGGGHHQVVVLRVSLHCKGCVAKLRKHLSKMEGVTSFSIDLETKRVTVTGSVSPSEVLTSISKVKNAQFWPSPATSPSSLSSSSKSSFLSRSGFNSM